MNLYPLTKDEANLLLGLLKTALTQASDVPMDDGKLDQSKLTGIISVIKSGGLKVYLGSVTDQDGDSTWELTSSLRRIHDWADEMSIVSFEVPKTYRISVGRSEFGFPKRLTRKPDPEMSELSD